MNWWRWLLWCLFLLPLIGIGLLIPFVNFFVAVKAIDIL